MTLSIRRSATGLGALILSLGCVAFASLPRQATAQTVILTMIDDAFDPVSTTVPTETTITWVNQGLAVHTITSDSGDWDSGLILPGEAFSFRFTQTGTFPYRCLLHPAMKGTIIVEADTAPLSASPAVTDEEAPEPEE